MSPQVIHRIKHFIEFFAAIPSRLWCMGWSEDLAGGEKAHCALGHLGSTGAGHISKEGSELCDLLEPIGRIGDRGTNIVIRINDKDVFPGKGPRERILNALQKRLEMEATP